MKSILFTTDTTHHWFFARTLHRHYPWSHIVIEEDSLTPSFPVAHPFERERDEYEKHEWLSGEPEWKSLADTRRVSKIGDNGVVDLMRKIKPDVLMVFGTSRLPSVLLPIAPYRFNLHGGNPEEYRGLDTHLWAIYHGDFENLVTSCHLLEPSLDTGAIHGIDRVPLVRGLPLYRLRSQNTILCVSLAEKAFADVDTGTVATRPQKKKGRYYSFMPGVLKDQVVKKFGDYTNRL